MTSNRNWRQDKLLTPYEIAKLKQSGVDIHDLKGGKNASKKDLYKDEQGNIY
ncbi:MAG: polymorphic toxin type 33 domain-containing protein, partial [Crocosphaera sp.]